MRILPLALIAIGVFGVLKHYGLVDPAFAQLFWPLLLIGVGVVMLLRGPVWRRDMRERMRERRERRMHRRFGQGWANLSEEERQRFCAGMRQWRSHRHGGGAPDSSVPTPAGDGSSPKSFARPPAAGEQP